MRGAVYLLEALVLQSFDQVFAALGLLAAGGLLLPAALPLQRSRLVLLLLLVAQAVEVLRHGLLCGVAREAWGPACLRVEQPLACVGVNGVLQRAACL